VLPTGGGKTFVFSNIISDIDGAVCAIAHRGELVSQISLALAKEGVRHRIIGSRDVTRQCSAEHMEKLGRDFISPTSRVAVASVDTLVRMDPADPWFPTVRLWVLDEAHHLVRDNKWHRAVKMFTNAFGLGVTATPLRADGKGLGAHADGCFHVMVLGPTMRWLIDNKFLANYRLIAKPSQIDLSNVTIAADGDYSKAKLSVARAASTITGDIVQHYIRFAGGKQGITFDTDVAAATATAAAFREAGISAEVVHGDTPGELRRSIIAKFRRHELLQMVNVDLFGEGFDVPACEVASFGRPTQSYGLYVQQFGRPCRIDADNPGKVATIIDHVDNHVLHGLPDAYREWSLDRRERRAKGEPSDAIPTTVCTNPSCASAFERYLKVCPYCKTPKEISNRSAPEFVDGNLEELSPEALARLRGDVARIDGPALMPKDVDWAARGAIVRRHSEAQQAQVELRNTLMLWSGWQTQLGREMGEQYQRFYYRYGLDVMSAQALRTQDAKHLKQRIEQELARHGVRAAS